MRRLLILITAGAMVLSTQFVAHAAEPSTNLTLPMTGTDVPDLSDVFDAMDVCYDYPDSVGCNAFIPFISLILTCAKDPANALCSKATAQPTPTVVIQNPCTGPDASKYDYCQGAVVIDKSPGSFCYKNPDDPTCNPKGTTTVKTGVESCEVNPYQEVCKDAVKIEGQAVKTGKVARVVVADPKVKYVDKDGNELVPKPLLDNFGNQVSDQDGKVIYRTIIITSAGAPVTDKQGNAVYSEVAKDDSGKTLLTKQTKKSGSAPVLVFNVLSSDDKLVYGPDGKPLSTLPALRTDGFAQVDRDGKAIQIGRAHV